MLNDRQNSSLALNKTLPLARTKDLVIQNSENETLVYDLKVDKAHNLNETVSFIWDHCDGKMNTAELISKLSKKLNTKIEEDFIELALSELDKAKLLENNFEKDDSISRRKVLLKYALPAVMLPVVLSLVAPSVSAIVSCLGENEQGCPQIPCCDPLLCSTVHFKMKMPGKLLWFAPPGL